MIRIGALPVLFSKKRRHYLTLYYTDDAGKRQAAILEVARMRTAHPLLLSRFEPERKLSTKTKKREKASNQ